MSLQYSLELNPLTERPDDYKAVVRNPRNVEIQDVIKQITKPGSILKETECNAVINDFLSALCQNMSEGIGFTSEYFNIAPTVAGVFDSDSEAFNAKKHSKNVSLAAGPRLREAVVNMKVERVESSELAPVVKSVLDIKTQSLNQNISRGSLIEIKGEYLKVEGENAGVFLIAAGTGPEILINQLHINEPKRIMCLIPETVKPGNYYLEIRSHVRGAKNLRSGNFNKALTLA